MYYNAKKALLNNINKGVIINFILYKYIEINVHASH